MAVFLKKETTLIAIFPRLILIGILCLLLYPYNNQIFFVYALFIYLLIHYIAKYSLIPGSTFTGVKLMKEDKYEEAMPFIQRDIDYFTEKAWIDKFRFVLMISTSSRSYREICLCNLAWCLLQTGKVRESKELYERILVQYPENPVAKTQLNTINMITKAN